MIQGPPEAFAAQVARVRESGALGRSQGLARLFDCLADPVHAGKTLSEADVAHHVFGRALDLSGDASVRVYVHRLRKKLEGFYQGPGADQPYRLSIPVGEYRLDLVPADASAHPEAGGAVRRPDARGRLALGLGAIAAVLLAVVALALVMWRADPDDRQIAAAAHSPFWAGLGAQRPVIVVVGDYYIFGDTGGGEGPQRMIRAFEINSPADLDAWLMDNPTFQGRYVDLDTYYTPVGATLALRQIVPVAARAAGGMSHIRMITSSQLTAEMMKSSDIVYVGYLSALRGLQEPVFARSRYEIGPTFDELIDRRSGADYVSSAGPASGDRPNRDYGYLAMRTGAGGARIRVIAGARDIGVVQAAEFASDPKALARVRPGADGAAEALYAVDGVGRTTVGARPVEASR